MGIALKRKIRNFFCGILGYLIIILGIVRRAKEMALSGPYITPIYFHNPSKKLFRNCIRWLKKNGYKFISTDELIYFLKKKKNPPNGSVWISFDDGWRRNMNEVIPVIIEENIPVTFFIPTKAMENQSFWFQDVKKFYDYLPSEYKVDIWKLWDIEESERKLVVNKLRRKINSNHKISDAMSVDNLTHIASLPQITIGSHTVNHAIIPNCSDEELDFELAVSKKVLEEWTGQKINCFAFPNGDYNGKEKIWLQKTGYDLAATIDTRLITKDDDIYYLPRFGTNSDGTLAENICHMVGVWFPFIEKLKKFFR